MNCMCLMLVKNQPDVKSAWNMGLSELYKDTFFSEDDNIWIRDEQIDGSAIPAIPDDPDEYKPYGFQKVSVRPYDWKKDYKHQGDPIWLVLPHSRKAKDADQAFFQTLKEHIKFFNGDNFSCAVIDGVTDNPNGDSAVVEFDPESSDLVGEIKDAGPNDWLFFVNYHGC